MELRSIGKSGLRVSAVGLGCNNLGRALDLESARKLVHRALDLGVTLFDTADIYGNQGGSEEQLGEILGPRRKDIVLATKFGMPMSDTKKGASRAYIFEAVEASLKRLKTDWIDLYQLHQPDPATPIEDTLTALNDLIRAGKVRHIGCSNLNAAQVGEAAAVAREKKLTPFISAQDEYSLLVRDVEAALIPTLESEGMGLLPYFPLASGMLTGKYTHGGELPAGTRMSAIKRFQDRYMTETNWAIVDKLSAFCKARNHTLLELAFSWLLSKPVLSSVIAGATKPEQIEANVNAAGWKLSAEDIAEVAAITKKS
ncbi:MAG TPA: aldo/keto reductase [Rhizomicrobium sp.]|nr:aldo/keto reductase [Rhizomicrobium sp.]